MCLTRSQLCLGHKSFLISFCHKLNGVIRLSQFIGTWVSDLGYKCRYCFGQSILASFNLFFVFGMNIFFHLFTSQQYEQMYIKGLKCPRRKRKVVGQFAIMHAPALISSYMLNFTSFSKFTVSSLTTHQRMIVIPCHEKILI